MHATLCDLMMDILQNSIEANATTIRWTVRETAEDTSFIIEDDGKGMSAETQAKAIDPFYSDGEKHVHRRVGLGLPFLFQTAEAADGRASLESTEGVGTRINFTAKAEHFDLPPFGDFTQTAVMMMSQMPEGELHITRECFGDDYELSRTELLDALGDLNEVENLALMKTYIQSQEDNLRKAGYSHG